MTEDERWTRGLDELKLKHEMRFENKSLEQLDELEDDEDEDMLGKYRRYDTRLFRCCSRLISPNNSNKHPHF
jgi:hypothetical protein